MTSEIAREIAKLTGIEAWKWVNGFCDCLPCLNDPSDLGIIEWWCRDRGVWIEWWSCDGSYVVIDHREHHGDYLICGHDTYPDALLAAVRIAAGWSDERAQVLQDRDDDYRAVMSEDCAPDEQHCSCVPHLRRRIAELEAEVERLRKSRQGEYRVECAECGRPKKPVGRDSTDNGLCDSDCPGYPVPPAPPLHWSADDEVQDLRQQLARLLRGRL